MAPETRAMLERRLVWLEANAARCERVHPKADCHKRYRRNAAEIRALLTNGADDGK